jgi:hypothetical protein
MRADKKAKREAKEKRLADARAAAAAASAWKPYGDAHKLLLDVVEATLPLGSGKSSAWAAVAADLTTTMADTHNKSCKYEGTACYEKFCMLVNKSEPTGNDDEHLISRAKKIEQLILNKSGARTAAADGISALETTGIPSTSAPPSASKTPKRKATADGAGTGGKKKMARFGQADLPVSPTRYMSPSAARCSPAAPAAPPFLPLQKRGPIGGKATTAPGAMNKGGVRASAGDALRDFSATFGASEKIAAKIAERDNVASELAAAEKIESLWSKHKSTGSDIYKTAAFKLADTLDAQYIAALPSDFADAYTESKAVDDDEAVAVGDDDDDDEEEEDDDDDDDDDDDEEDEEDDDEGGADGDDDE